MKETSLEGSGSSIFPGLEAGLQSRERSPKMKKTRGRHKEQREKQ